MLGPETCGNVTGSTTSYYGGGGGGLRWGLSSNEATWKSWKSDALHLFPLLHPLLGRRCGSWRKRVGGIHGGGRYSWRTESGPQQAGVNCSLATGLLEGSRPSPGLPAASIASGLSPLLRTALGPALSSPSAPDLQPDFTGEQAACDFKTHPSARQDWGSRWEKCQGQRPSLQFLGVRGPSFRCGGEWAQVTRMER